MDTLVKSERAEIIRWARELDAIGKSSSISSEIIVPLAGKELDSDTKGLVHISCPQLNAVIADWLEAKRQQGIIRRVDGRKEGYWQVLI